MDNCKHCSEPVSGNYCSNCGQPVRLRRIDRHYIMHEIRDVLFTDSGFLYTIKRMFVKPGDSVRHYLNVDRSRFVKAVTFLVISSLIYTVVCHLFHIGAETYSMQEPEIELPTMNLFVNWTIDNHGYTSILVGFLMSFWIKLFFRKSDLNLFEIFVLMCFISGISELCISVVLIFQGLTQIRLFHISILFVMVYQIWAIGQFFDKRKAVSYIKAFLSYALGIVTFSFITTFIVILFDVIIKQ